MRRHGGDSGVGMRKWDFRKSTSASINNEQAGKTNPSFFNASPLPPLLDAAPLPPPTCDCVSPPVPGRRGFDASD